MAVPEFPFPRSPRPASGIDSMPGGFTGMDRDFPGPRERVGGGPGWAGLVTGTGENGGQNLVAAEAGDGDEGDGMLGGAGDVFDKAGKISVLGGMNGGGQGLAESAEGDPKGRMGEGLDGELPALSREAAFSLQQLSAALMRPAGAGGLAGSGTGGDGTSGSRSGSSAGSAGGGGADSLGGAGAGALSLAALADQLNARFTTEAPEGKDSGVSDLLSDSGPVAAYEGFEGMGVVGGVGGGVGGRVDGDFAIDGVGVGAGGGDVEMAGEETGGDGFSKLAGVASTPAAIRAAVGALSHPPGRAGAATRQGDVFFMGGAVPQPGQGLGAGEPTGDERVESMDLMDAAGSDLVAEGDVVVEDNGNGMVGGDGEGEEHPYLPEGLKGVPPPLLSMPSIPGFLRRAGAGAADPVWEAAHEAAGSTMAATMAAGSEEGEAGETRLEDAPFLPGLGGSGGALEVGDGAAVAAGGGLGLVLGGTGLVLLGIWLSCRLPLIWLDQQGAADWAARKGMAGLLLNGVAAVSALGLGVGSLFSRRWAPPLIHAAGWLTVFSAALLTGIAGFSLGSEAETTLTVMDGWLLAAGLLVPLVYLLYYERADTAAICQASDPGLSWTDRLSTPALMVWWCGLALAAGAGAMLFLHPAFPVPPDRVLSGPPAQGLWAGLAAAGLLTAICAARRSALANWILLAACLVLAVCLGFAGFSAGGGGIWHEFSTALGRPSDAGPPLPLLPHAAGLATLPILLALAMARRAFASPPPP